MKNLILILVIALLVFACPRKVDLEAEKENVITAVAQYIQMLENEDIDLLAKLTAPETDMVSFGTGSDERIVGWEDMKEFMEIQFENTETKRISFKDQVIKVHKSGNAAWFSMLMDWDLIANEQEIVIEGLRATGVLEKQDGNWVFVQMHYSVPAGE